MITHSNKCGKLFQHFVNHQTSVAEVNYIIPATKKQKTKIQSYTRNHLNSTCRGLNALSTVTLLQFLNETGLNVTIVQAGHWILTRCSICYDKHCVTSLQAWFIVKG